MLLEPEEDMAVEERLRSKILYKIELGLLKIMPMLLALVSLINSILSYFRLDLCFLSYIGGVSFITIIFLYLSSYVFKFCSYHRVFLHYIVITWIINLTDYYVGIPMTNLGYLCLQMVVAGIALFIILYLYVRNHKKAIIKNSK